MALPTSERNESWLSGTGEMLGFFRFAQNDQVYKKMACAWPTVAQADVASSLRSDRWKEGARRRYSLAWCEVRFAGDDADGTGYVDAGGGRGADA